MIKKYLEFIKESFVEKTREDFNSLGEWVEYLYDLYKDDEEKIHIIDRITSINGVGQKTALALVATFGNLKQFTSVKAFVKFIGLCPTEFSSGISVKGGSHITKKGSGTIRSLLFNCARSAIRFNEPCKTFYQKLVEKGKNGKVALTAVMHKIARLIFGVVHSGQMFDPKFALSKTKSS